MCGDSTLRQTVPVPLISSGTALGRDYFGATSSLNVKIPKVHVSLCSGHETWRYLLLETGLLPLKSCVCLHPIGCQRESGTQTAPLCAGSGCPPGCQKVSRTCLLNEAKAISYNLWRSQVAPGIPMKTGPCKATQPQSHLDNANSWWAATTLSSTCLPGTHLACSRSSVGVSGARELMKLCTNIWSSSINHYTDRFRP